MDTKCISSDHIHCHVFSIAVGAMWNTAYHEDSHDTMSHLTGKWNFFSHQKTAICNGQSFVWCFWFYCLYACMQQSTAFLPPNFLLAPCLISSQEVSGSKAHNTVKQVKSCIQANYPVVCECQQGKFCTHQNFLTELQGSAEHSSQNTGQKKANR